MLKIIPKNSRKIWRNVKQWFHQESRVLLTATGVAGVVILIRSLGLLQVLELTLFDQFIRLRPSESIDERIVIVGIDEQDLQQFTFPIPDDKMADLLLKIHQQNPSVIGLDIFRDIPRPPGTDKLNALYSTLPNLIGIEQVNTRNQPGVKPPYILQKRNQIGFNNVLLDIDGKVRRVWLYLYDEQTDQFYKSFALKLASIYLEKLGIKSQNASRNPDYLQFNSAVFNRFTGDEGAYIRTDARGYQILANLRGRSGKFNTIPMRDILSGNIPPDWAKGKIVLIGSTATSVKDFLSTSYSAGLFRSPQEISGVELHANFISQIISAALNDRLPTFYSWSEILEWFWIWTGSFFGSWVTWRLQSSTKSLLFLLGMSVTLVTGSYLVLLIGWWIPVIPPLLALGTSTVVMISHLARLQEEFKRSKDFLQTVINTIPDPIFVKDKDRRQIVLNNAYCRLIGYPLDRLLSKTDYQLFPRYEADVFWEQDEEVFTKNVELENEEELTDSRGVKHHILTKRSLHQDAAGNQFLVGVIRDITERKQLEEELKRSNAELRQTAYHDPLTGLPNRKLFRDSLNQAIETAMINHRLVGLLFLDLDGFKSINDTLGHDVGDLLLKGVAQRLQNSLRGSDTISRLGGDEFTVILPGIPGPTEIITVAEKILSAITQPFDLDGHQVTVTTSIGISLYPIDAQNIDNLIKNADAAMYRAKELGKNRYEFS